MNIISKVVNRLARTALDRDKTSAKLPPGEHHPRGTLAPSPGSLFMVHDQDVALEVPEGDLVDSDILKTSLYGFVMKN